MTRAPAVVLICLAVTASTAVAEVRYVDASVANPGNGRSWEGAYRFLQDALSDDEDILQLIAVWATDPGGPPDFDGSGDVGIDDFLELLANWSECD